MIDYKKFTKGSENLNIFKIPTYKVEELDGKTLKIYSSKSDDGKIVIGIDQETDVMYVLHQEIKMEGPALFDAEWPNLNGRGTSPIFSNKKPPKPPKRR